MQVIKRRRVGGKVFHFLAGGNGQHDTVALCGAGARMGTRPGWRYPGSANDNMAANPKDCARCVDAFIKAGGQFSVGLQ